MLVICDSVPACVAVDRLRPCTPAELLASHYTHTKISSPLATDTQIQQGFIDERAPLNPTTVDPSRTAHEGGDEDEQDDELSEPIQSKRTAKRKEFQTDETAKELGALLPTTDSSHAFSPRSSDKTQEAAMPQPQRREWRRFKMSHICSRRSIVNIRETVFLQVRMAGMRKSNKKKVLKKKDGERNLHFPSCALDVQATLRETRRIEWNKWIKFNAGITLKDEEVRQFTAAGCEIYPMRWVDTDKKRTSTKR